MEIFLLYRAIRYLPPENRTLEKPVYGLNLKNSVAIYHTYYLRIIYLYCLLHQSKDSSNSIAFKQPFSVIYSHTLSNY
ncbi:uncharacterized protein METZ01_LOCUS164116 [marine metagenome]|uniref:Uncharacterized protein n=1 Tax=marine metagenome TaxID=408172 RepID=A0A382BDB6_9ZZZZ